MELIKHNFKELLHLVVKTVLSGRVAAIWGPPGIGKTALGRKVRDVIEQKINKQVGFYVLDAPLLQPFDYTVAVPDHNSQTVKLYRTGFLPEKGPAVVLVEDLPHAKPYQVIPIMQIVLEHRIGPLYFSDDVYFIITGNREEDLANVHQLPSPLYNRLVHFEMEADLDVWREWAKGNRLDPRVIGFVYVYPQYFCQLPQEGVKAWPTPRSWHILSDLIKDVEDETLLRSLATAAVGASVASVFISWIKYLQLVEPKKVLETGVLPRYTDRTQLFAILCALINEIKRTKKEEIGKIVKNIVKIWQSLESDYKIFFIKELLDFDENSNLKLDLISYILTFDEAEPMKKFVKDVVKDL
jgi:hypothetical protein